VISIFRFLSRLPLAWLHALGAALGWLAVFGAWCRLYLPIYLKPRSDGAQG